MCLNANYDPKEILSGVRPKKLDEFPFYQFHQYYLAKTSTHFQVSGENTYSVYCMRLKCLSLILPLAKDHMNIVSSTSKIL